MKKIKPTILKGILFTTASIVMLSITSCQNNMDAKDTKETAEEHNDAKFSNTGEGGAKFLVSAAEFSLEEIELGQLAQKNSAMPDVIALGKMMEEDHTKALNDLKALAAQKQISIPATITDSGQNAFDNLKDKTGSDFDNDYCDMMVKGHKDAIGKFEKVSTNTEDADIQSWATIMLSSLRTHLDHAITCQEKCAQKKSKS